MPRLSTNQFLLDRTIRRTSFLQDVKTKYTQDVVSMINDDVLPDLADQLQRRLARIADRGFDTSVDKTARLRAAMKANREMIGEKMTGVESKLVGDLNDLAQSEAKWQVNMLGQSTSFIVDFVAPSAVTLNSIIESRPFQGDLLSGWFDTLESNLQDKITRQINIGLTQGESVPDMIRRLVGTRQNNFEDGIFNGTRREAEAVVRTAANHVSTHARETTYEENSDVIDQVQMVATLDTRTTYFCMKIDGKVFDVNVGPRPPFHFNCRTTTAPVVKSWDELGIKGLKEAPASTRASMNGQVADKVTYGDWLKQQDEATQIEALGAERAQLFRSGEIKIDQFATNKGRTRTLAELDKLTMN